MTPLLNCPAFQHRVKQGKQAIKPEHRTLVTESRRGRVKQSLDFDAAAAGFAANTARWDYLLSTTLPGRDIVALEVHAFRPTDLLKKQRGTRTILGKHCPGALNALNEWHVIVTGELRSIEASRFRAETGIRLHRAFHIR